MHEEASWPRLDDKVKMYGFKADPYSLAIIFIISIEIKLAYA